MVWLPMVLVGPATWDAMGLATTDDSEKTFETSNGLIVNRHFLPEGEYKNGPTNKEYMFLAPHRRMAQSIQLY